MMKSIKIMYEDWINTTGLATCIIKEAIVDFDGNNTPYVESMSYSDNFDSFIHDAFNSGFVYLTPRKAVSILQIKYFEFNDAVESVKDSTPVKVTNQPMDSNHSNRKSNKRKLRKQRKPIEKKNVVINTVAKDGVNNEG